MFYELDSLETQLKCPNCKNKYTSPRILPCGKSICQNCIEDLCQVDSPGNEKIQCPLCNKTHLVPNDGFILNEFILKTLELRPKKVYRYNNIIKSFLKVFNFKISHTKAFNYIIRFFN